MALLLSACGGGGGAASPAPPPASDKTPPTIVCARAVSGPRAVDLLTPAAAQVAVGSSLVLTLDEKIQCPAVQPFAGTFGSVTGQVTCADAVWTLVPSAPLAFDTRYDLTVSFSDLAGNAGAPFATWFMTASAPPAVDTTPPTLVGVSVASGATVPVALPAVTYTFTEDVTCKGQVGMMSPAYSVVGTTTCAPTMGSTSTP